MNVHLSSAALAPWIGNPGVTATTNWSDTANWTAGAGALNNDPKFGGTGAAADAVTITSVVDTDQNPLSLQYSNAPGQFHLTLIPAGVTLSNATTLTIGGVTANAYPTVVGMVGGGTLIQRGNMTIGNNGATAVSAGTLLDLSGLSNFVFNASTNSLTLSSGNRSGANFIMAAVSNHITAASFNANIASSGSTASGNLTLGAGTNVINANTFNVAANRNTCTVQFPATGGLRLRGVGGTDADRANMTVGNHNTGGTGSTAAGTLAFNGHPVDLKLGTLTLGQSGSAPTAGNNPGNGTLQFDTGIIDANAINMAIASNVSFNSANATITVGANGTLVVGAGGISMVNLSGAATVANGTLNIDGGTVQVSGDVRKTSVGGIATLSITGGKLNLSSATNVVGTPAAPIDNVAISDSTLTLPVVSGNPTIVAATLNTASTTNNTINISSLPGGFPAQYPLITYATLNGVFDFVLGTLPGTYQGYISNNAASLSVDLVITNSLVKTDVWRGNVNGNWDTFTLNWLFSGSPATYQQGDLANFDDTLTGTPNVNLTTTLLPGAVNVNNSTANYVFSGSGKISGTASLTKSGTGPLTLAGTGGDDFTGGLIVENGTVILDNTNSAISGGLIINGGTVQIGNNNDNGALPSGSVTDHGVLVFNRTNSVTVATAIAGTGTLTQNGSGVVTLTGANAYSGATTVANGTLALAGAGTLSNSAQVVVANSTLDVSALAQQTLVTALNVNNAAITVALTASGNATIAATSLNIGGPTNLINVTAFPPIASYPATLPVIQAAGAASGVFNFGVGTLPAATPSYAATASLSPDQTTVLLTVTSGPVGARPVVHWSGADLVNLDTNWSERLNWQLPGAPVATDNVVFRDTAAQVSSSLSTPGGGSAALIPDSWNNLVDTDFTISSLVFTNLGDTYHNTYIASGKSLTVTNAGGLTLGALNTGTAAAPHGFVTILGNNATLNVSNTAANINIWNGNQNVAGSQATLDLSALDNFNVNVSRFILGATINNVVNRPSGVIYLAKTNSITAGFQTSTIHNGTTTANAGIVAADCNQNAGSQSFIWLGQRNTIRSDTIAIGRQKANGRLRFNPIYANIAPYPSVILQGFNSNQVSIFNIGDGVGNTGTTSLNADADFTGGTVTANVNVINVGRASSAITNSGTVTAFLIFDAGTINANTLNIGLQPSGGDATKFGIGTVAVGSNAVMGAGATLSVTGNISLANTPPTTVTTTTSGTLNITNGVVQASNIIPGTNSTSTVGLYGGRLSVTGKIGSLDTPLTTLELASLGTPDNSVNILTLTAAATPAVVATTVNVDGLASTTNIINITAAPAVPGAEFPLIQYTALNVVNGTFNIGLGSLPVGFTGYLTNDTAISAIALVVTAAPRQPPVMTGTTLDNGNLITSGTNGYANGTYYVLGSTNVALPFAAWERIATNTFDASGNFIFTNAVDPTRPQRFFIMQVP